MRFQLCALVLAGTIGAACDGSPVRPQETQQSQSPSLPALGFHLTGVVRDDRGAPVAGATVTSPWGPSVALTNEAGQFDLPFDRPWQAITVSASKAGYEPDTQIATGSSRDLTLYENLRISVGESVRVTVGPNDAYVEDEYLDGYRIRMVRVFAGEAMTVNFRLEADESARASIVVRNATLLYPPHVNVTSAIELLVEVRVPWNLAGSDRTFTLHTSRQAAPPTPAPVADVGSIVVEVLPFSYSNPCAGAAREQCEPRGRVVVDDSDRAKSFAGPGTLTWTDIPAGEHTLSVFSGIYLSGDAECRFFLRMVGDRTSYGFPLKVFLRGGDTQKFEVPFICI